MRVPADEVVRDRLTLPEVLRITGTENADDGVPLVIGIGDHWKVAGYTDSLSLSRGRQMASIWNKPLLIPVPEPGEIRLLAEGGDGTVLLNHPVKPGQYEVRVAERDYAVVRIFIVHVRDDPGF